MKHKNHRKTKYDFIEINHRMNYNWNASSAGIAMVRNVTDGELLKTQRIIQERDNNYRIPVTKGKKKRSRYLL